MSASSPPILLNQPQGQPPGRPGVGGDHIIINFRQFGRSNSRERRHHAPYPTKVETSLPAANLCASHPSSTRRRLGHTQHL